MFCVKFPLAHGTVHYPDTVFEEEAKAVKYAEDSVEAGYDSAIVYEFPSMVTVKEVC